MKTTTKQVQAGIQANELQLRLISKRGAEVMVRLSYEPVTYHTPGRRQWRVSWRKNFCWFVDAASVVTYVDRCIAPLKDIDSACLPRYMAEIESKFSRPVSR